MKIKRKIDSKLFFLLIVIFFFFTFFFISYSNFLTNSKQTILIFSKEPFLDKENSFEEIKYMPNLVFNKFNKNKKFNKLFIQVDFEDLLKLKKDRSEAIKRKVLLNNIQYVNAKIIFKDEEYDAKIKLKGSLSTHWENSKQWSFKITLENGYTILGMREFSLTKHSERAYPANQIMSDFLRKLKIYTPEYFTFAVDFNGLDWGIMLAEEQISSTYHEKRKLKDSVVLRLQTQDRFLSDQINFYNLNISEKENRALNYFFDKRVRLYNQRKYLFNSFNSNFNHNKNLESLLNQIKSEKPLEDYIDIKKIITTFTLSLVWQEYHSMHSFQSRYYLNPFTSKLEIIPLDFGYGSNNENENYLNNYEIFYNHIKDNHFLKESILHDDFEKYFYENLVYIKNNFDEFHFLLKKYCKGFSNHCGEKIKLNHYYTHLDFLIKNYKKVVIHLKENLSKEEIINFEAINNVNEDKLFKFINFNNSFIDAKNYNNEYLEIINLSPFELNIVDLDLIERHEDKIVKFKLSKNIKIESSDLNEVKKFKIKINEFDNNENFKLNNYKQYQLLIKYKIKNIEKKYLKNIYPIFNKNFIEFSNNHNFIKKKDENFIIESGEWVVNYPIIISNDKNLIIEKNTKLKFSDNSYLLIDGGSLITKGEKNNEVLLTSKNKIWKGIYINNYNNSDNLTKLSYTTIQNAGYFENNKTSLTGSVNFYRSNIVIENSQFIENQSEDALNITESNLKMTNTEFKNISSDAFDSDFSKVVINNVRFAGINGDAIDTSGSNVKIRNVITYNVGDKSLSAGEGSIVEAQKLEFTNSRIGIATKDSSEVIINECKILNSSVADIISYRKKHLYSYGKIFLKNSEIDSEKVFYENQNAIKFEDEKFIFQKLKNFKLIKKKKYPNFFDNYIQSMKKNEI